MLTGAVEQRIRNTPREAGAVPSLQDTGAVAQQLERLHSNARELCARLAALESRIDPILRPMPPPAQVGNGAVPSPPPDCALAEAIRVSNAILEQACATIEQLHTRVDL